MFFLGVDQSLNHTGLCILDGEGALIDCTLIEPRNLKGPARLAFLRDAMREHLVNRRFEVSVLEGYSFGSLNRKFDLGEVGSIVKLALYDHSNAVFIAAPKQLKRFVTSDGSACKEAMMAVIEHTWGVQFQDDNLADAYGLAQIARGLYAPTTTKRHQLDVLHDIRGTKLVPKKTKAVRRTRAFKGAI